MKGIESKSLPRGAVKVEQARPGAGWDGARGRFNCTDSTYSRTVDVPWMRDVPRGRGCAWYSCMCFSVGNV
jgi:hypothetical protein